MRKKITASSIAALKPRELISDDEVKGFRARRLPSGKVTFGYQYRNAAGALTWLTLGLDLPPLEARRLARIAAGDNARGESPAAERRGDTSIDALLDNYLARRVGPAKLRTAAEIKRSFDVYVRPRIGAMSRYKIGRGDISRMLDDIVDHHGAVQADRVLACLRAAFNWEVLRDEKFTSPIVTGMARTKPVDRARSRILDDAEIVDLYRVLDAVAWRTPVFARFVRALLLTGQRFGNVAAVHADAIDRKAAVWEIKPEPRAKLRDGLLVPLSAGALAALAGRDLIFASPYGGAIDDCARFTTAKRRLDRELAALRDREGRKPMPAWTFHDLRRTARSIMSSHTTPDIAERAIGHRIGGVRGIYDRAAYLEEKRAAFEALGRHVENLVNPPAGGGKVVSFPKRKPRAGKTSSTNGRYNVRHG